ncbi:MAG: Dabb family protein [Ignavibacteriae bacterium]|nr:MAG: Dabb family protein [Ignavibacteriota bacterium]
MVKHIVCWNMTDTNGRTKFENAKLAAETLLSLKDKINVIRKFEVGINDERASKDNFDVTLISEFDSFEDLDIYQKHPEHVKAAAFIKTIRITKAAVDFEV